MPEVPRRFGTIHDVTKALQSTISRTISGKRFAFAVVSWGFSSIAVLVSLLLFFVPLSARLKGSIPSNDLTGFLAVLPAVAWVCLAVMTTRWLQDRRCHWGWVVVGLCSGFVSGLLAIGVFVLYVSSVPLGFYLTCWHLCKGGKGLGSWTVPDRIEPTD
ncbi:hypothetical protein [Hydrogenophaga sp. PAMC20947]|uniref:hypothetical protein n=1 Tax=Hydrogenophaga sp. PAMC20947 TaxID=2565558 RepID=UPI00109E06DF|nr:hypothetical protein [Hydrogenophaga sp. PAMC20947]QCB46520.1 hypothetical protein E5678_11075 [Hydrogenophaga sp. PAMC20947]